MINLFISLFSLLGAVSAAAMTARVNNVSTTLVLYMISIGNLFFVAYNLDTYIRSL